MTLASQSENQQYFHQRLRIQTEARVCLPDIMRSVSDKYNTYPWGSIKMGGNPILPNLKRGRHASPAALDSPGRTAERTWLSKNVQLPSWRRLHRFRERTSPSPRTKYSHAQQYSTETFYRDYRKFSFYPCIVNEFNNRLPEAILASMERIQSYLTTFINHLTKQPRTPVWCQNLQLSEGRIYEEEDDEEEEEEANA